MKKQLTGFILILIMMSQMMVFATEVELSVSINDQYIEGDAKHILIDDTAYIVARTLVETLGGTVSWDDETKQVGMMIADKNISLTIDSDQAIVNENKVQMSSAPFIRNGRTYIPLRFVTENFGVDVVWDGEHFEVKLSSEQEIPNENYVIEKSYNYDDILWLSRIIQVETSDGSLEMKLAVANVVLNRVKDARFPNSVYDVIFQIDVYTQFPPAHKDSFQTLEPSHLSKIAAKKALEGVNVIEDGLFFNNQPFKSKSTDDLIRIIEGEYFYR